MLNQDFPGAHPTPSEHRHNGQRFSGDVGSTGVVAQVGFLLTKVVSLTLDAQILGPTPPAVVFLWYLTQVREAQLHSPLP